MGVGVSKAQIQRAKEIGIEDYILRHEPNNVRHIGHAIYLKDHDSLEISNGLWNWHSRGIGGKNVVDYLIFVRGYCFVDAVRTLAGEDFVYRRTFTADTRSTNAATPGERQPEHTGRAAFKLPPRNADNKRVIAYLQNRGIDWALIEGCINRGILFESNPWHNCVFVGRDESGKARFAAMRGTMGDFKRDAAGSDKSYGFCLPPNSADCRNLAVFESPIDALSHVTAEPRFDCWRLSLGGTALPALARFMATHNEIERVVVCTDNDDAGEKAAAKIFEMLNGEIGVEVTRSRPPAGKDWNETLSYTRSEVIILEDKRKDIVFRDANYKAKFKIKDGERINVTRGCDGGTVTLKCRWIDECHTKIGNEYFHIDEYAEKSAKAGNVTEPVTPGKPRINILTAKFGEALQPAEIPMEVQEENENHKNAVDFIFEKLEKGDPKKGRPPQPQHFALRQYKKYKLAAGMICSN